MSSLNIITLVLTSSVLSAGLTALVNWVIQKRNYRNEYFKRLLEKRLNAYEEVEDLIAKLTSLVAVGNGQLCNVFCYYGKDYFGEFLFSVRSPIRKAFWLSDNVSGKLTELNIFLLEEIDNKIDENKDYDNQLVKLGILNVEKIRIIRKQLQEEIYKDFRDLDNVEKFIKSLRPDKQYPLYNKPSNLHAK